MCAKNLNPLLRESDHRQLRSARLRRPSRRRAIRGGAWILALALVAVIGASCASSPTSRDDGPSARGSIDRSVLAHVESVPLSTSGSTLGVRGATLLVVTRDGATMPHADGLLAWKDAGSDPDDATTTGDDAASKAGESAAADPDSVDETSGSTSPDATDAAPKTDVSDQAPPPAPSADAVVDAVTTLLESHGGDPTTPVIVVADASVHARTFISAVDAIRAHAPERDVFLAVAGAHPLVDVLSDEPARAAALDEAFVHVVGPLAESGDAAELKLWIDEDIDVENNTETTTDILMPIGADAAAVGQVSDWYAVYQSAYQGVQSADPEGTVDAVVTVTSDITVADLVVLMDILRETRTTDGVRSGLVSQSHFVDASPVGPLVERFVLRRRDPLTPALSDAAAEGQKMESLLGTGMSGSESDSATAWGEFDATSAAEASAGGYGLGMDGTGRGGGGTSTGGFGIGDSDGARDAESGDEPKTKLGYSRPTVSEGLRWRIVKKVINQHKREMKRCYDEAFGEGDARPKVEVEVRWIIDATGYVSSTEIVDATEGSEAVQTCLADGIQHWRFPKPKNGAEVEVTYPIVVYSDESPIKR